jgi:2,4-dienoyl-CoA reductase-like NADH-dependent reductase (Old Yellow Enzyme family)/thioredoxin reductase
MVTRAKGGVGLIITECADIMQNARFRPNQIRIWDDSYIPSLKKLADAVHQFDCKIAVQLVHASTRVSEYNFSGTVSIAPSAIPYYVTGVIPHEPSEGELEDIIDHFGQAASRVVKSGCDAVEVHGAHGYLLDQFCSPFNNKRNDRFGGSPGKRATVACEVVRRVRKYVGPDFPIIYRLQADDFIEGGGGITLEESKIHARLIEDAGADILSVTGGNRMGGYDYNTAPNLHPRGHKLNLSEEIKSVVGIPIQTVGRIVNPRQAEKILEDGIADLIGMARALLADPEFPNKAREGRYREINECIGCNTCLDKDFKKRPYVSCALNPACGREREYKAKLKLARKPRRVLVVGGGPGGMSAAKVAAERGHRVWLYEKEDSLGGQLKVASVADGKYELAKIVPWYEYQFKKLGVLVELNRQVTRQMVEEIGPNVLIVATGARIVPPDVPGINRENVTTAIDVLAGKCEVGKRVVVIGGGLVGIETTVYLAEKGRKVTIVSSSPKIGLNMGLISRLAYWRKIPYLGIPIYTEARLFEVKENGVQVLIKETLPGPEWSGDELVFIPADTVVLARDWKPDRSLIEDLEDRTSTIYAVGDCVEPLKIIDAVHEGARVAFEI